MALSNQVTFALTRDDLITQALQHIGAIGDGDTPNPTQIAECSTLLNMLIKSWQPDGLQLWMRYYGYILPSNTTPTLVGAEGGHAVTQYVYTTTTAGSSSGGSTITVADATSINDTDVIGIELDDGTMQWTTVSGTPVGSVVTLASNLTGDVADGADVYAYQVTAKITRPYDIIEAFRRHSVDQTDTPLVRLTSQEYNLLGNKNTTGIPVQWFYDKGLNFSTSGYPGNGAFYVWPIFQNGDDVIVFKYIKLFDDLAGATDNPEFPQEWFLPLMLGLAWLLGPKHGLPLKERQMLFQEMMMIKKMVLDADQEWDSIYFQLNNQMRMS